MEEKKEKVVRSEASKRGVNNKRKGSQMERDICKKLRELGYLDAVTTRASSRMLDAAKLDINFVPFNIQSKNTIKNMTFSDYIKLLDEVITHVAKLPKELAYRIQYPTVVFHKKDRETLVTMKSSDFYNIIKQLPK